MLHLSIRKSSCQGRAAEMEVEYVSQYKCSARAKRKLEAGLGYVDDPMVDWAIYGEFADEYQLDTAKDNKSVWDPRWLVFGLLRYGDTISTSLAERFKTWSRREPSDQQGGPVPTGGRAGGRELGSCPASGSTPAPKDVTSHSSGVLEGRRTDKQWLEQIQRAFNSTHTRESGRHEPSSGFDSDWGMCVADSIRVGGSVLRDGHKRTRVYAQAVNATLRIAGNRSRRYQIYGIDRILGEVLHGSKSAGAPFFGSVVDNVEAGVARAIRIRDSNAAFDPNVAYSRIQHGPLAPKGRLVWGSPLATTILASQYAKPAYEGLRHKRVFAYGRRKSTQSAVVSELQSRYKRVYSIDFSGFDSSVPAFIIADAFQILRTYLEMSEAEENLFDRLVHDFIHSRIVLPDCSMWQKHRGIPSGSPFTSLVGSLCNLIILNYMWIRATGRALDHTQVMVLGDDSIVGTNAQPAKSVLAYYAAELGMTMSEEKSMVATLGTPVHFLGHTHQHGLARRDERDVVIHVVYEERHQPPSYSRRAMRLYGFMSESLDAYRIIAELISSGQEHLPLEVHFVALANDASRSDVSLGKSAATRTERLNRQGTPEELGSEC
jgi:hypothetical protein